jgi:general L-amino acid transport system permease protein
LNLTKNSSLAIGIGFLDLYAVSNTMLNQSGRVVEVFLMIMASYLTMSLTISSIMNVVNRRIQIVER